MGIIRGILFVLVVCAFFVSVFVAGFTLTLSTSLRYDNVKTELSQTIKNFADEQINLSDKFEEVYPMMDVYCESYSEYVFSYGEYTFVVPCDVILEGYDAVLDYGVDYVMKEIYDKEYDCDFFDCFKKDELPLFLISEKSRSFWHSKFYFMLTASVFLAGLMFLLVEKKTNMPIIAGILIIIASLPFMKLDKIIVDFLTSIGGEAASFLGVFFTTSFSVFIKMLFLGIFVLFAGIIFKIFGIGFKISSFFSKFSKGGKEPEKPKKETPLQKTSSKNKPVKKANNLKIVF